MNMFLKFAKLLKWTLWKIIMICAYKLILTCVFQTFKKESINSFELDPYYYLSAHGYRWNAMLSFTDVNSKLISDIGNY